MWVLEHQQDYLIELLTFEQFDVLIQSVFSAQRQVNKVRGFLDKLLHQESQVSVDVYAYMFFCDFFNFFVLIFGFAAFGVSGSSLVLERS